jgi:tetratricopeptide (TPR) repeat protein
MAQMWRLRPIIAVLVAAALTPSGAFANPASAALRARAADALYNLDQAEALMLFRQAAVADPADAAAHRGVATLLWIGITFRRGNLMVDDYLGRPTKPNTTMAPPTAASVAAFREVLDRAVAIARSRIAANAKDADAHYQLGAAVGLRASYAASVDNSMMNAFRSAREAYDEHETVLELNPARKDAGLIVGTYRYVVSTLALPMRWAAYVAGFGGGRERGLQLIESAAAFAGENEVDARFALLLLYNRERRYDDALKQLAILRERYPRNRLLWLETGATCIRAGRWAEAERFLAEGMARLPADSRPRMFGEEALWQYKLGVARARLKRTAEAEQALAKAVSSEGRPWVHGRSHIELGRLARTAGNREAARQHWQTAIKLCESDNDPASAAEARRLLNERP